MKTISIIEDERSSKRSPNILCYGKSTRWKYDG